MFCADNYIVERDLFSRVAEILKYFPACYPNKYAYLKGDNSLNRYFSLIGGNDPVCWFIGKNDRNSHVSELTRKSAGGYPPSYGCNGFFYRAEAIKATNLDHYYPMDNATEVRGAKIPIHSQGIWHRTSDNLIKFMMKRYRYARDLYCDRQDRRWKVIDTRADYWRLFLFILSTITVIHPILVSITGFKKIKDKAWFWHFPICLAFIFTYGVLTIRWLPRLLLSRLSGAKNPSNDVRDHYTDKQIKILRSLK